MQLSDFRPYFRYAGISIEYTAAEHFRANQEISFALRELDYTDQWKLALREKWLHFLLEDKSFFLFSEENNKKSYSFYPCPLDIPTLRQFLAERGLSVSAKNIQDHEEEYGLVLETANLRTHIAPIRYDEDSLAYRGCTHPTAHLHIGFDNEIRFAFRRHLTPLAFVLLVIRQHYPRNWDRLLPRAEELRISRKIRSELPLVEDPHWVEIDELQTYLA